LACFGYSYTHDWEKTGYKIGANKNSDFNTILGDAWKDSLTCKIEPSSSDIKASLTSLASEVTQDPLVPYLMGNIFLGCRFWGVKPRAEKNREGCKARVKTVSRTLGWNLQYEGLTPTNQFLNGNAGQPMAKVDAAAVYYFVMQGDPRHKTPLFSFGRRCRVQKYAMQRWTEDRHPTTISLSPRLP
jgi:hypothetical protein